MSPKSNIRLGFAILISTILGIGALVFVTIYSNQDNKYSYRELLHYRGLITKKLDEFDAEKGEDRGYTIEVDRKEEMIILQIPYLSDKERKLLKNKFGKVLEMNIIENLPEPEQTDS
ncbi:MAG TPA: hypothetical protein VF199_04645 [Bacillales bacterium]